MLTPRSAEKQGKDTELAVIRPSAAIGLLVLAANFARHHLLLWVLSMSCLAVGLWLYCVPVERRSIDRIRWAHACFYACMAFFLLQIVAMFLA
ncbi:MAG TPA: hypothetical protein VN797_04665 [Gemmatimonadaceae bacterium]|jgi:hypothetical protein|nr:hypothetical protein [Gemmatimonadaceae bacterium]